jgi:hypothetical protein
MPVAFLMKDILFFVVSLYLLQQDLIHAANEFSGAVGENTSDRGRVVMRHTN